MTYVYRTAMGKSRVSKRILKTEFKYTNFSPASPVVTGFMWSSFFDFDYKASRQDKACGEAGRALRMGCPFFCRT